MPKTQYIQQKEKSQPLFMKRGDVLSEFFEISDKAREGGMGDVFFCRDKRDNKFCVLKTFKKYDDEEKFRKEALLCLSLPCHPYVTYTRTIINDGDTYYILMDYVGKQPYSLEDSVKGETLESAIKIVDRQQALIWASQICKGMIFLNDCGIEVHRDIKPSNILISPDNNIKITDFGLSSIENKGGTPGYIPPEYSLQNAKPTVRGDIYSFGILLYQLLNRGQFPYQTAGTEDKLYQIDASKVEDSCCGGIIQKCLAEDPRKRYKNFEEIDDKIEKYIKQTFPIYIPYKEDTSTKPFLFLRKIFDINPKNYKDMSAQQLFLRGQGYYLLTHYKHAFTFLTLAIQKDKSLKEAHLLREKCRGAMYSPSRLCAIRFILLLIVWFFVISVLSLFFSPIKILYKPFDTFFPLLPVAVLLGIIFLFSKYRDYENEHPEYLIPYYILPIYSVCTVLLSRTADSHPSMPGLVQKLDGVIRVGYDVLGLAIPFLIVCAPLFLLMYARKKSFSSTIKELINKGKFYYTVKEIYASLYAWLLVYWPLFYSQDRKYVLEDSTEFYKNVVNNPGSYTSSQQEEALSYLIKCSDKFPRDIILWYRIKLASLKNDYKTMLEHIVSVDKEVVKNSIYSYDILLQKALCYIALEDKKHAQEVFGEIEEMYRKFAKEGKTMRGRLLRGTKDDPNTERYNAAHVGRIALLAYTMLLPASLSNQLDIANLLYDLDEWKWAKKYYQENLPLPTSTDLEKIDEEIKQLTDCFNREFLPSSKISFHFSEEFGAAKYMYQKLAFCQYQTREYANSFKNFSLAIEKSPRNRVLYVWRLKSAIRSFRQSFFYVSCFKDFFWYLMLRFDSGLAFQQDIVNNLLGRKIV